MPGAKAIQAQPFEATIFKYRIIWSSNFGGEFVGRGYLEIHFGIRSSEQFAGKIVPGATAFTGSVIEAIGIAATERYDLTRQFEYGGRAHDFAVYDPYFASFTGEMQHQIGEVFPAFGTAGILSIQS